MRLIPPLAVVFLLLAGCGSDQQAADSLPPSHTPSPATTPVAATKATYATPQISTVMPVSTSPPATETLTIEIENGGGESACTLTHYGRPKDNLQAGFMEWLPDGLSLLVSAVEHGSEFTAWEIAADGATARRVATLNHNPNSSSPYGFHADLSPDGERLVYSTCKYEELVRDYSGDRYSIPVYDLEIANLLDGPTERLTHSVGADHYPAWSPDGSRIAYIAAAGPELHRDAYGPGEVWVTVAERTEKGYRHRVQDTPRPSMRAPVWSPDNKYIAIVTYTSDDPEVVYKDNSPRSVYVAGVYSDTPGTMVGTTTTSPVWSPDGKRLAFAEWRDPDGAEIHVVSRDGTNRLVLADALGPVMDMAWHPDGSELLVVEGSPQFVAEGSSGTVKGGIWTITPDGQTIRNLYRLSESHSYMGESPNIEWSPDGSRFSAIINTQIVHGETQIVHGGWVRILVTATREGDDWQVLAVWDEADFKGFRLCSLTTEGPFVPSSADIENHCEPAGEQKP